MALLTVTKGPCAGKGTPTVTAQKQKGLAKQASPGIGTTTVTPHARRAVPVAAKGGQATTTVGLHAKRLIGALAIAGLAACSASIGKIKGRTASASGSSSVVATGSNKTPRVYVPGNSLASDTFRRTGRGATYTDSSGLVHLAAVNEVSYSEDFSNAVWTTAGATKDVHGLPDPSGGLTASQITLSAGGGNMYHDPTPILIGDNTVSCYIRRVSGATSVRLELFDGTLHLQSADQAITSSWTRISAVMTAGETNASGNVGIITNAADQDVTFELAWFQSERGTTLHDYIPTGSVFGSAQRDAHYIGALGPHLLVEGTRTNILHWSRLLTDTGGWFQGNVVVAQTQTGVDGVSNSASSITAIAADGVLLQTVTLASSQRLASAYVKRLSGTGVVEMTTDNGTTWTALTLTSSYTRLSIPAQTLADPVTGFRIRTNGDSIAVDYVQNEDGAFASTPIYVTDPAVTRGKDSLLWATRSTGAGTRYIKYVDLATGSSVEDSAPFTGATLTLDGDSDGPRAYAAIKWAPGTRTLGYMQSLGETATASGVGTARATGAKVATSTTTASAAGVGTATTTANAKRLVVASASGTGATVAGLTAKRLIATSASGSASTTAGLHAKRLVGASTTGAGSASVTRLTPSRSASASGVGSVTVALHAKRLVATSATGLSSSATTLVAKRLATANGAGVGTTTVTMSRITAGTNTRADGAATATASLHAKWHNTASAAGAATTSADCHAKRRITTAPAGVGAATVTAGRLRNATTLASGTSTTTVVAHLRRSTQTATSGTSAASASATLIHGTQTARATGLGVATVALTLVQGDQSNAPSAGKFGAQHDQALAMVGGARGFSAQHTQALAMIGGARGFSSQHAQAKKMIGDAGT